jgi:hypothetical protein
LPRLATGLYGATAGLYFALPACKFTEPQQRRLPVLPGQGKEGGSTTGHRCRADYSIHSKKPFKFSPIFFYAGILHILIITARLTPAAIRL